MRSLLQRVTDKLKIQKYIDDEKIKRTYSESIDHFKQNHTVTNKSIAVVVHLFYTENWPLFRRKLLYLQSVEGFDLYFTIPKENTEFIENEVTKDFPAVKYLVCPNRGRDVLPFLTITKILADAGYESILKFHSKKSTHWDGGQSWLEKTLDQIIPEKEGLLGEIVSTIKQEETGVLGPAEFYYPLTVNFPANGVHLSRFVIENYGKEAERHYLQTHRAEYGFFGGTMLWMRLDAIQRLLNATPSNFELERGQIDGTYAHAVERLLCLIPQIENKINYQCDGKTVNVREYSSDNIPEWSEDHDK